MFKFELSRFYVKVSKQVEMEFERELPPGHPARGVVGCHPMRTGTCKQCITDCHQLDPEVCTKCTTCAICNESLGSSPATIAKLAGGDTSVYWHTSCADCPSNVRRSVQVEWEDEKKETCIISLKHEVGCKCESLVCAICQAPFSYGRDPIHVRLGPAKCCGNTFRQYHLDCLPQKTCSACDKGPEYANNTFVSQNGKFYHSRCIA